MKILKYKKGSKGIYKVELSNGIVLALYEDTILKFNLLLSREILEKDLDKIKLYNLECEVYYVALESIKARFKSEFELKKLLERKEYPGEYINKALQRLKKEGYLNDRVFARSYINNQMITTNHGPNRIERDLLDKKIDGNIISDEIVLFTEDETINRINRLITKKINSNHNKGGNVLKQKIANDLKLLGYDSYMVNKILNNYDFSNDYELAEKEYNKLYKRLSKKYSGSELELRIKQGLYLKGLKYEKRVK